MKLISPFLLGQLALATILFHWYYETFPARTLWLSDWSALSVSILFTLCYFLLDDFARFYVHRLLHKWPALWSFHKVHHSATHLTPFTVFRTHPIESIIFSLRSALTQGLCIGTFVFFLGDRADLVTVIGANIFIFIFNVTGSNLRHSHIHIGYWKPIEKWIISPAQHQVHHSIEHRHWDKNFGVALAIWDRMFGSLYYSEPNPPKAFGINESPTHDLKSIYLTPFAESWASVKKDLHKIRFKLKSITRSTYRKPVYERSNESR